MNKPLPQTNDAPYGRRPVDTLYAAYQSVIDGGWIAETPAVSSRERSGRLMSLPIPSFRTKQAGRAIWIISGIHGEEPAGPNAIAAGIGLIRELGRNMPVVLLPLCNPLGYATSWRYLNRPDWQEGAAVESAGDSEHVLPDLKDPSKPRAAGPASAECAGLVAHVLKLAEIYPPALTIDLHEDDLLDEGYIYSQGPRGADDPAARKIVGVLASSGVPLRMSGKTRFGEEIKNGIVGPQGDGSIDELLASKRIIVKGKTVKGPAAQTVIVVETPAAAMPLEQRERAHLAIIERLRDIAL